jgi:hypothetical protein
MKNPHPLGKGCTSAMEVRSTWVPNVRWEKCRPVPRSAYRSVLLVGSTVEVMPLDGTSSDTETIHEWKQNMDVKGEGKIASL